MNPGLQLHWFQANHHALDLEPGITPLSIPPWSLLQQPGLRLAVWDPRPCPEVPWAVLDTPGWPQGQGWPSHVTTISARSGSLSRLLGFLHRGPGTFLWRGGSLLFPWDVGL